MKTIAVIPARYASTRFPGKPLVLLQNKPIIQHVYKAVKATGLFDQIIIATDDLRIRDCALGFGAEVKMTSAEHQSGSDRIAEVIRDLDVDVIVNIQGDEPFITKEPLQKMIEAFSNASVSVASVMHKMDNQVDIENPNNVKVVVNLQGDALYFSRSVIPYNRDKIANIQYYKHIGVYAYRKQVLLDYVKMPVSFLEKVEKLEQLRFLEAGYKIRMVLSEYKGIGIDTPEDLLAAEAWITR